VTYVGSLPVLTCTITVGGTVTHGVRRSTQQTPIVASLDLTHGKKLLASGSRHGAGKVVLSGHKLALGEYDRLTLHLSGGRHLSLTRVVKLPS
jgi:hypothetical protein